MRAVVDPRPPLDRVQLLGVRCAAAVEPELVVVADGVDDERVAFPAADRVPPPGRDQIVRVLAAIHVDDAMRAGIAGLVQDIDVRHALRRVAEANFHGYGLTRGTLIGRQAVYGSSFDIRLSLQLLRPRQQRQLAGLQSAIALDVAIRAATDPRARSGRRDRQAAAESAGC